jgi:selenophosphate synthetase-related protein
MLVAAIDHRGRYREPFNNWEAATDAPPARLRADLELLPEIAEAGLALSAKDISQSGIVGTAIMLAECSHVGIHIDVTAIPLPADVSLDRWLVTFPSFGYLLSVAPDKVEAVIARFTARGISAAAIGSVVVGREIALIDGKSRAVVRDYADAPLLQLGRQEVAA